jgi:hypothetical protein
LRWESDCTPRVASDRKGGLGGPVNGERAVVEWGHAVPVDLEMPSDGRVRAPRVAPRACRL